MLFVTMICESCGCSFERTKGEATRNTRMQRPNYCSLSCAGRANVRNFPIENWALTNKPKGRASDIHSPFRTAFRIARRRARLTKKEFSLSLEHLKEVWEAQEGMCPYTGWNLILPFSSTHYNLIAKQHNPQRASLDRIDSSLGYINGNVQFVCHMANTAKGDYTHDQMMEFCAAIATHHANKTSTQ